MGDLKSKDSNILKDIRVLNFKIYFKRRMQAIKEFMQEATIQLNLYESWRKRNYKELE